MCAADKVALVNTLDGADLGAFAASCAKVVVDNREVVLDLYSTVGAGLFALHTADTAVCALLTCDSALFMI